MQGDGVYLHIKYIYSELEFEMPSGECAAQLRKNFTIDYSIFSFRFALELRLPN